jgi:hypothetical protein
LNAFVYLQKARPNACNHCKTSCYHNKYAAELKNRGIGCTSKYRRE